MHKRDNDDSATLRTKPAFFQLLVTPPTPVTSTKMNHALTAVGYAYNKIKTCKALDR